MDLLLLKNILAPKITKDSLGKFFQRSQFFNHRLTFLLLAPPLSNYLPFSLFIRERTLSM